MDSQSDPHAPSEMGHRILNTEWTEIPIRCGQAFIPPPPEPLAGFGMGTSLTDIPPSEGTVLKLREIR